MEPEADAMSEDIEHHSGWLWKEGEGALADFKKRWFVLVRDAGWAGAGAGYDFFPSAAAGKFAAAGGPGFTLHYYDQPGAAKKKGSIPLPEGGFGITSPKQSRNRFPHAFRLDLTAKGKLPKKVRSLYNQWQPPPLPR